MSNFRFEEPPPSLNQRARQTSVHMEAAKALRRQPNRWARIKTTATAQAARNAAHQIRNGRITAYNPPGHFEAVSRTVDGEFRVYARYVGGGGRS